MRGQYGFEGALKNEDVDAFLFFSLVVEVPSFVSRRKRGKENDKSEEVECGKIAKVDWTNFFLHTIFYCIRFFLVDWKEGGKEGRKE